MRKDLDSLSLESMTQEKLVFLNEHYIDTAREAGLALEEDEEEQLGEIESSNSELPAVQDYNRQVDEFFSSASSGQTVDEYKKSVDDFFNVTGSDEKRKPIIEVEQVIDYVLDGIVSIFRVNAYFMHSLFLRTNEEIRTYFDNVFGASIALLILVGSLALANIKWFIFKTDDFLYALIFLVGSTFILRKLNYDFIRNLVKESDRQSIVEIEEDDKEEGGDDDVDEEADSEASEEQETENEDKWISKEDERQLSEARLQNTIVNIPDNMIQQSLMNPNYLYNLFKSLMFTITPDFNKEIVIQKGSPKWINIHFILQETIEAIFPKCSGISIISMKENLFCLVVTVKPIRGISARMLRAQKDSIVAGFKEDSYDPMEMDIIEYAGVTDFVFYKSSKAKITLADVLSHDEICKEFFSEKYRIPFLAGIKKDLSPWIIDLLSLNHILITGATGAGKGWLVYYIIDQLCRFNPPTKVSFVIIDPKNTNSFAVVSKLPHVVHLEEKSENYLRMLDLVSAEAQFRQSLFKNHHINDYNSYFKSNYAKGLELPVLIFVIDEMLALSMRLDKDDQKVFMRKLIDLASVTRSAGIKIILMGQYTKKEASIPPTVRANFTSKYSVRHGKEDMEDYFAMKVNDITLVEPGDVALMVNQQVEQLRQPVVGFDEDSHNDSFHALALAWAKINPQLPKFRFLETVDDRDKNVREYRKKLESGSLGIGYSKSISIFEEDKKERSAKSKKSRQKEDIDEFELENSNAKENLKNNSNEHKYNYGFMFNNDKDEGLEDSPSISGIEDILGLTRFIDGDKEKTIISNSIDEDEFGESEFIKEGEEEDDVIEECEEEEDDIIEEDQNGDEYIIDNSKNSNDNDSPTIISKEDKLRYNKIYIESIRKNKMQIEDFIKKHGGSVEDSMLRRVYSNDEINIAYIKGKIIFKESTGKWII